MLKHKNILRSIGVLALLLVQLGLLFQVIFSYESLRRSGYVYKFHLQPADPYDAFRGRYLYLNFMDLELPESTDKKVSKVYDILIKADEWGFAEALDAYALDDEKPSNSYLQGYISYNNRLSIPFSRFYLQEEYAKLLDKHINEIIKDNLVYATLAIKDGKGRILDVYVNDTPIVEYLKQNYLKEQYN
ncbi:MAG: GDYXXLXY domain-containing protein [Alphaproteobacteria bacterium]